MKKFITKALILTSSIFSISLANADNCRIYISFERSGDSYIAQKSYNIENIGEQPVGNILFFDVNPDDNKINYSGISPDKNNPNNTGKYWFPDPVSETKCESIDNTMVSSFMCKSDFVNKSSKRNSNNGNEVTKKIDGFLGSLTSKIKDPRDSSTINLKCNYFNGPEDACDYKPSLNEQAYKIALDSGFQNSQVFKDAMNQCKANIKEEKDYEIARVKRNAKNKLWYDVSEKAVPMCDQVNSVVFAGKPLSSEKLSAADKKVADFFKSNGLSNNSFCSKRLYSVCADLPRKVVYNDIDRITINSCVTARDVCNKNGGQCVY